MMQIMLINDILQDSDRIRYLRPTHFVQFYYLPLDGRYLGSYVGLAQSFIYYFIGILKALLN